MKQLTMDRVSAHVTAVCNLRCEMCSAYIPYNPKSPTIPIHGTGYSLQQLNTGFSGYFDLVSRVRMVSLSGGEPLLFREMPELIRFLSTYSDCYEKLEIFTNGTLVPSEDLLEACTKNGKAFFLVDHYGPEVSTKSDEVEKALVDRGIGHTVRKYFGEDCHMGGWIDYGLLSGERLEYDSPEIKDRFKHCLSGNNDRLGLLFTLFGEKLYVCPFGGLTVRLGLVSEEDAFFIDFSDTTKTREDRIAQLDAYKKAEYLPACSVCHGNDSRLPDKPRYTPGVQF